MSVHAASSHERSSVHEIREAKRKLPAERHGELLAKAVEISAAEGLSAVTLRRVATDLGVTPGLVSHYFSSAEQLITAAFRTAAIADLAQARSRVDIAETPTAKMDALMDYVLDESSEDASALWLDAWSLGRRNVALAGEANALTDEWLESIADIVALRRQVRRVSRGRRRRRGAAPVDDDRRARRADGGTRCSVRRSQAHRALVFDFRTDHRQAGLSQPATCVVNYRPRLRSSPMLSA